MGSTFTIYARVLGSREVSRAIDVSWATLARFVSHLPPSFSEVSVSIHRGPATISWFKQIFELEDLVKWLSQVGPSDEYNDNTDDEPWGSPYSPQRTRPV